MSVISTFSTLAGVEKKPKKLEIEITRKCPLKCIHCSVSAGDNTLTELSIGEIEKLIVDFSQISGQELVVTGGEPLSRGKRFIAKVITKASQQGLSTFIYTSGFQIDESFVKSLKSKLATLCISIEGKERTHDSITGIKDSYKKAIAALELCLKYNIATIIHFTPMKVNYQDFEHILEVYQRYKVSSIKIFNFSAQGRGLENKASLKLSPREQADMSNKILNLLKKDIIKLDFGGEIVGINNKCSVGQKVVVTCDGNILPCLGLRAQSRFIIGNVREKTLSELWYSLSSLQSNTCLCG